MARQEAADGPPSTAQGRIQIGGGRARFLILGRVTLPKKSAVTWPCSVSHFGEGDPPQKIGGDVAALAFSFL